MSASSSASKTVAIRPPMGVPAKQATEPPRPLRSLCVIEILLFVKKISSGCDGGAFDPRQSGGARRRRATRRQPLGSCQHDARYDGVTRLRRRGRWRSGIVPYERDQPVEDRAAVGAQAVMLVLAGHPGLQPAD